MNRLYRTAATPSAATAPSSAGLRPERLAASVEITVGEPADCAGPVGEQPGCTDDDPDGPRPGGSLRARVPRLTRGDGR